MSNRTTSAPAALPGNPSTRRNIIIAVVALFLCSCCFCAVLVAGYWAVTAGPLVNGLAPAPAQSGLAAGRLSRDQAKAAQVAATFVQHLQTADWATAYGACTPALQRRVGNSADLGRQITDAKSQPSSALVVTDVGDVQTSNGRTIATVVGTARFGSTAGPVRIDLEFIGAEWKVNGFSLNLSD